MVDELCGHEDGPLFLVNINNNLASAGYDCEVLTWSLSDIDKRVWEKTQMEKEDLLLGFSKLQGLGNDYLYIDCLDKYRWLLTEGAYDLH